MTPADLHFPLISFLFSVVLCTLIGSCVILITPIALTPRTYPLSWKPISFFCHLI